MAPCAALVDQQDPAPSPAQLAPGRIQFSNGALPSPRAETSRNGAKRLKRLIFFYEHFRLPQPLKITWHFSNLLQKASVIRLRTPSGLRRVGGTGSQIKAKPMSVFKLFWKGWLLENNLEP